MTAFPAYWYTSRTFYRTTSLVLAAALAAACSGYNPPPTVRRGGDLVVALGQDAQALNPLVAGDVWSVRAYTPLYPQLYEVGAKLSCCDPSLADGDPELSKDALTWTVRLRDRHWSDGKRITAGDVVYTIRAEMDTRLDTSAVFDWSPLKAVAAVDDRTVRFTLTRPDAAFLARLVAPIVPRHSLADVRLDAMSRAMFTGQPLVGGGPFHLKLRTPGQAIVYTPNRWYFPAPHVDTVQMRVISDPAKLTDQLAQGYVTWAPDVPPAVASALKGLPNVTLRSFPELGRYSLVFNTRTNRPYAGTAARRAVFGTLDPARVAAAAGGVAVYSGLNSSSWLYDTEHFGPYTRPAGAAALPSGTAELLYPLGDKGRAAAAQEVERELGARGAAVRPVGVPPGDFASRLQGGDFDLALAGLGEGIDPDPSAAVASWETPERDPHGQNFGAYADGVVDTLVRQELAASPPDPARRKPVFDAIQAQLRQDPPFVDLWTYDETDAFGAGLADHGLVGPWLDQDLQSSFYARWSLTA